LDIDMIEINLLPGASRSKKAASAVRASVNYAALLSGITARFGSPYIIAAAVVGVLAVGAVGYLFVKQGTDNETTNARLDKAMTDSTHFAGVLKARAMLEAKRDTLLRQVNLIHSIDDDRYIWPHVLDEVSRTLPAYTWITILGFSGAPAGSVNVVALPKPTSKDTVKAGKPKPLPTAIPKDVVAFRITGRTVDIQALTKYYSDLASSPFITGVQIEQSLPGTGEGGKELYEFTITAAFKRPDSTAIHRTPFVVTVH
jgi:type IV pilus assembly protein PilN